MPEIVKVMSYTGGKSIIASGMGITFNREADYEIRLDFTDGFSFTVRLKFSEKVSEEKPEMNSEVDEERGLITLECLNFSDIIGTGTKNPLHVATYQGQKVYFNFLVRSSSSGDNKEIRYCFYLEENNGDEE